MNNEDALLQTICFLTAKLRAQENQSLDFEVVVSDHLNAVAARLERGAKIDAIEIDEIKRKIFRQFRGIR